MSRYSQRESAVGPARVAITPAVCLSQIIAAVSRASPPLAYPNCPLKPYDGASLPLPASLLPCPLASLPPCLPPPPPPPRKQKYL
ncbi:hypothetical protein E2C01_048327 [Portunus trituberculatus]|uniref:Uncharacterized protein n=1 Tax=Portunus trituberculatus TaxID=210409 RepID=A0A5B7G3I1_PORTR|nr:hypothetical protein [Portunus trituberculatus]